MNPFPIMSRRVIFLAALAALCFAATGAECRTLEAPASSTDIWEPPRWEKSTKRPDGTWTSIRAKSIDPSRSLGLDALVDLALSNSPVTRRAWEQAKSFQAKQAQAKGALLPSISATMELAQQKTVGNYKANNASSVQYGPGVQLSYLLLDWGGRDATIKGATFDLIAANFQYNQTFQDLMLSVATAYYTLYAAQANVLAKKADVDNAKVVLDSAQKKLDAGLVSKLDVLQAESTYYDNVYALEVAKGDVKTAKAKLAQAIGFSADTPFRIARPPKLPRSTLSKQEISLLIDRGLHHRPNIAVARANLNARNEAIRKANSDLWPSVTFDSSLQQNGYHYGKNGNYPYLANKEWGSSYTYSLYTVTATWNIFDGFANYNKKVQAKADARAQEAYLYQLELTASSDVWSKFYTFRANIRKFSAARAFLKSSTGSYKLAFEGYKAGLKSILDLTKAEDDLSNARTKLITSEKDLFNSAVELIHALGELYPGSESVEASSR